MGLKRIAAPLVVVIALLMSGCAQSPGVAATVNGHVIGDYAVQQGAAALKTMPGAASAFGITDFGGFVLSNEIFSLIFDAVMPDFGITISDDQRDEYWNTYVPADNPVHAMWTDPRTKAATRGFITMDMLNSMASQSAFDGTAFVTAMTQVSVSVNPRYGDWDQTNLDVASRITGGPAGPLAIPTAFQIPT